MDLEQVPPSYSADMRERVIARVERWCIAAGGRTLRSQRQYGGNLCEVLSRDRPLQRPRGGSTSPLEQHAEPSAIMGILSIVLVLDIK
jgi:hypothetical protein